MRLNRFIRWAMFYALIPLLFSITVEADYHSSNGITDVSLVSVISNPEKYEGMKIRLMGYFVNEFEGRALYLSRDDARNRNIASSIWIDEVDPSIKPRSIDPVRKGFVRIVGTFKSYPNGGGGHLGLWSGALANVTFLKRAK